MRESPRRLLLLAALALAFGCGADEAERDEAPVPAVEAVPARQGSLPLEERVSGVVRAADQVTVRPQIEAPVVRVLVRSGDAVERGQPLVELDGELLRDRLRQAAAALDLAIAATGEAAARRDEIAARVTRSRALAAEELVSDLDLEQQEAQLAAAEAAAAQARARAAQARASVEEARTALGRTVVRSPVAGRVGQRLVEVGQMVGSGDALFVVGGLDRLIVEVPVTEEMVRLVRPGQPVRLHASGFPPEGLGATLSRLSPFLAAGSLSTVGEIELANPGGMVPGMFVAVDLLYGETAPQTLIPAAALWEDPRTGSTGVWVLEMPPTAAARTLTDEPWPVALRPVEVLGEGRGVVGVGGLEPGKWVVTVGQHLLHRDEATAARVRPVAWERVLELQGLQREDLLADFLARQQEMARARGAEPPSNEEFLAPPAAGGREGG